MLTNILVYFLFCMQSICTCFIISNFYFFLDSLKELSWMKPDILIKHMNVNVFSHKHYAQNLIDYLSDNFSQITLTTEL